MDKMCEAFLLEDPVKASEHILGNYEVVINYGDELNGNRLYVWDDGCRLLARCKKCGGFILIQVSECHGMEDDTRYRDYIPVDSKESADKINEEYSGYALESESGIRYLIADPGIKPHWSK